MNKLKKSFSNIRLKMLSSLKSVVIGKQHNNVLACCDGLSHRNALTIYSGEKICSASSIKNWNSDFFIVYTGYGFFMHMFQVI